MNVADITLSMFHGFIGQKITIVACEGYDVLTDKFSPFGS